MSVECFVYRTRLNIPAAEVFRWHARPGALERLTPPWEPVTVLERTGGITNGSRVTLGVRLGPFRQRWISEHRAYQEDTQFCDVQIAGPFAHWEHMHGFTPAGPSASYLEDRITYALPLGMVARLLAGPFVRQKLNRLFAYRHRITMHDLAAHAACREGTPMHVLVTGSTGLVGSALASFLTTGGHRVTRLVRSKPRPGTAEVQWQPAEGRLATDAFKDVDAVVHLAGENLATGRWTAEKKARIRDSRVQGTRLLCETLAQLPNPPRVLVSASAIGYYGDRGAELLREASGPGPGFLAEICHAWETATAPAVQRGIRVVQLRFGIILSPAGGALAKMLLPFKMGAGGRIGAGQQYMSWIALDEVLGVIHHALVTASLHGPVNAVAPHPVSNREFTTTLGQLLRRPTLVPLPSFAAQFAFGEMADALLLASTRVEPARLLETGYVFHYPDLEDALRHLLGKARAV
jgi:uncharacterized protein (TIGR01777 family)